MAVFTSELTKQQQRRSSTGIHGQRSKRAIPDPNWSDFDGVFMVGGDDDFGKKYNLRAMWNWRDENNIPSDYDMTDEEMKPFLR